MKKPKLPDEASRFWDRHASRLQKEGLLNDATFDSFVLLCKVHGLLTAVDPVADVKTGVIKFVALSKQFTLLSRGFGMNTDKPKKAEVKQKVRARRITSLTD